MYNFLTKKTARLLALAAIISVIICGFLINYVFYGGSQTAAAAFMV